MQNAAQLEKGEFQSAALLRLCVEPFPNSNLAGCIFVSYPVLVSIRKWTVLLTLNYILEIRRVPLLLIVDRLDVVVRWLRANRGSFRDLENVKVAETSNMTRPPEVVHDTRETHQPASVVIPQRTMSNIQDRVRLIRQGDNREISVLQAALQKGKGVRPWRLSTEQARLFYPAMIMREEEDRYRHKVMNAAGLQIDDQAPIAGMVSTITSKTAGDPDKEPDWKSGNHHDSTSSGKTSPTRDGQKPPSLGNVTPQENDRARRDRLVGHSSAAVGASAADRTNGVHPQRLSGIPDNGKAEGDSSFGQGKEGGGDGGRADTARSRGEPYGLESENDVRKRVLDLLGAAALDRLRSTFGAAGGWLGMKDFVEALCAACDAGDLSSDGFGNASTALPGDGNEENSASLLATPRMTSKQGRPAAVVRVQAGDDLHENMDHSAHGRLNSWMESAPNELVAFYERLFDLVSLQHGDWTTWDELSNFLLFDGDTGRRGGQGGPRQYLPAGSVHFSKILGLESAIVINVSRLGQELYVAAFLVRHSSSFMLVSLDGLSSAATPVSVKAQAGQVLAMEFVAPFNVLVTAGEKDRMIRCWDVVLKPKLDAVASKRQAKASEPQIMLKWLRAPSGNIHSLPRGVGGSSDGEEDVDDTSGVGLFDVLVSGGTGGTVNVWQLTAKHLVLLHSLPGHTGAVTSACILPHPEVIVTGSLDADIRTWGSKTYKCKRVMRGHSRGVATIEYSPSQRIIVSAGFDHDVLVWSPVAGQVICRLTGHVCSLVAARVSEISSDVISMSVDGIIKVWDSSNFKCVQTIHTNRQQETKSISGRGGRGHGGGEGTQAGLGGGRMRWGRAGQDREKKIKRTSTAPSADFFLFEGETSRLLVCRGTELDFYDNGRAGEKDVTDSNQTIDVMYHSQTGTFASVASTGVKLWDARTGRLTRAYGVPPQLAKCWSGDRWIKRRRVGVSAATMKTTPAPHGGRCLSRIGGGGNRRATSGEAEEITSACIDSRGHQIVLGFDTGRVACARYLTGRLVSQLDFHRGEVTDVVKVRNDESGGLGLVLSASDETASLQKMAVDAAEPRRTIAVLDPGLEAIRMETSKKIVRGTVANAKDALKQLAVGSKVLRAKNIFLTTLETFRGGESKRGAAGGSVAWSGAPTITTAATGDVDSMLPVRNMEEGDQQEFPCIVSPSVSRGREKGEGPEDVSDGERTSSVGGTGSVNNTTEPTTHADTFRPGPSLADVGNSNVEIAFAAASVKSGGLSTAVAGQENSGGPPKNVTVAGISSVVASAENRIENETKEVSPSVKVEEMRSPRVVAGATSPPASGASAATNRKPVPPPGEKPRPSSSLFNEKFARRFLRSTGGGGQRHKQDRLQQDRPSSIKGKQGEKAGGHGSKSGGREGQVNKGSHCRSHITSLAVSHLYQLAATGSLDGNVIVWDVLKAPSTHGLATLEAHNGYQVNSICFMEPHAALATCNLEGNVAIWRMGPPPDLRREYHNVAGQNDGDGAHGESQDEEENGGGVRGGGFRGSGRDATAAAAAAAAAAIKLSDVRRRRRATGRSMAPSSEWRCVALFCNNTTVRMHATGCLPEAGPGRKGDPQEVPVPAAVNSLAWSSLEERLFTGDTVGFVKVWDTKGALTSSELDGRKATSHVGEMGSNTSDIDGETCSGENDNGDKNNENKNTIAKDREAGGDGEESNWPPPPAVSDTSELKPSSAAVSVFDERSSACQNGDDSTAFSSQEEVIPANGEGQRREPVIGQGIGSDDRDCETNDGHGSKTAGSSYVKGGESGLWPSEASESIDGQSYGDRFGRGIGLCFIRRLAEWRPGREGRQDVIKVKIVEGESVMFHGVALDRTHHRHHHDYHRGNLEGNVRKRGSPGTRSGTVIVATITPDKLVRFWTSCGTLLGSLDQEYVASPYHKTAARPVASWRMCVGVPDVASTETDDGDHSSKEDGPSVGPSVSTRRSAEGSISSSAPRGPPREDLSNSSSSSVS